MGGAGVGRLGEVCAWAGSEPYQLRVLVLVFVPGTVMVTDARVRSTEYSGTRNGYHYMRSCTVWTSGHSDMADVAQDYWDMYFMHSNTHTWWTCKE